MFQPTGADRQSTLALAREGASVPLAFILLLAAWLLDFRSEGEGEGIGIQAYFAATYAFAVIMLLIGDRTVGLRIQGLPALIVCGTLYLMVGFASGLANNQQPYTIMRNGASVAIYLVTAYVTARVVLRSDPTRLRRVLSVFCLLYAVASYFITNLIKGGIDVEKVRFEIIGASVIAAIGYAVLAALFKLTKIEIAAMAVNGALVLISVTRSYLLVFAAQATVFIGHIRRVFSPRVIALGVVALLGVLTYGQQQLSRWDTRILGGGRSDFQEYQTFYTRFSEWDFMLRAWTESSSSFLFGSGLAARTIYFLPRELGGGTEFMIGFGHNQHLSMLFTAGIVGGIPLLLLQWYQVYLGWRFLRQTIRFPHLRNDVVFLGAWGATMILGHNAINIVSATFTTRGFSLWFGIGTGLLLGAQALFDPANAARTAPRPKARAPRYLPA
jgi:hypothetical protein